MSAIERYENMVDDLPSLSSDSTPSTPVTPATPPPTVSSSSGSERNTLQHIINNMDFPPGGPTGAVVASPPTGLTGNDIVKKETFKVC